MDNQEVYHMFSLDIRRVSMYFCTTERYNINLKNDRHEKNSL